MDLLMVKTHQVHVTGEKWNYVYIYMKVSYKGGGGGGYPEATRSNLREHNVKSFPGGAYPQILPLTPRSSVLCMINSFPSLTKKPIIMKPWLEESWVSDSIKL